MWYSTSWTRSYTTTSHILSKFFGFCQFQLLFCQAWWWVSKILDSRCHLYLCNENYALLPASDVDKPCASIRIRGFLLTVSNMVITLSKALFLILFKLGRHTIQSPIYYWCPVFCLCSFVSAIHLGVGVAYCCVSWLLGVPKRAVCAAFCPPLPFSMVCRNLLICMLKTLHMLHDQSVCVIETRSSWTEINLLLTPFVYVQCLSVDQKFCIVCVYEFCSSCECPGS
jgi:hypothetical protein